MARDKTPHVRIIAGTWRGRHLRFPQENGLRPSPDRVRETLFNWLNGVLPGARCLDLFAGSGALGFEALSRGAAHCTFVESNPVTCRSLEAARDLLQAKNASIIAENALTVLAGLTPGSFDLIFLDPPFGSPLLAAALTLITERGMLTKHGLIYGETSAQAHTEPPPGYRWHRKSQAGAVAFGLLSPYEDRSLTIAVYPGTFDPLTNGHIDIVKRAADLFPGVIVAVADNTRKAPLFPLATRVALAHEILSPIKGVTVIGFTTLLMDFIHKHKARVIVRGLRALSDFEYEFQMAGMNRRLDARVETIFLTASERDGYLSSSLVKEIAALGGDVTDFVHPAVKAALLAALR